MGNNFFLGEEILYFYNKIAHIQHTVFTENHVDRCVVPQSQISCRAIAKAKVSYVFNSVEGKRPQPPAVSGR
jgi:hypothetical protein